MASRGQSTDEKMSSLCRKVPELEGHGIKEDIVRHPSVDSSQ